jgi:hypothetical protein
MSWPHENALRNGILVLVIGEALFGDQYQIVKRRRLLYILALQYILDLTVQNDVICNYTKLGMFSIYVTY